MNNKYLDYIVSDILSERNINEISIENHPKVNSIASLQDNKLLKCMDDCCTITYGPMFNILTKELSKPHIYILLKNWITALREEIYNIGKILPQLSPWDDSKVRMFLRGSIDEYSILYKLVNNSDLLQKIIEYYIPSKEDRYILHSLDILSIFPKNQCSIQNIKDFGRMLTRMGEFLSVIGSFESVNFVKNDVRIL